MCDTNSQALYFLVGIEEAFGFPIQLVEEMEPRCLWRVRTPDGDACLKVFRKRHEAQTAAEASQYLRAHGFEATPRIMPAKDGQLVVRPTTGDPSWWLTLTEWVPEGEPPLARRDERDLPKVADTLARFHASIRGFRTWPPDLSLGTWLSRWPRVQRLTEILSAVLPQEQNAATASRLAEGLEKYVPLLGPARDRATQGTGRYRAMLETERRRGSQRHCDVNASNFLLGSDGTTLMDLAEIEPGPRILQDVARLAWAFPASDGTVADAFAAYHDASPLSPDEIALLPVVNDPVTHWGILLEGYLGGDWTEEMICNYYDGCVRDPDWISHRLKLAASSLQDHRA